MDSEARPPSPDDVEAIWRALIGGEISRQEVHSWSKPWVEDRWAEVTPYVESGLQSLHGFDMTHDSDRPRVVRHGPGYVFVHSDDDIAVALEQWIARR